MRTPIELGYPFRGRWLVRNSPANRVPSHGTHRFATAHAIDFVPVSAAGRSAPLTLAAFLLPEAPERFPGFGRPILAPAPGRVIRAHDGEPDHPARRGLPSVGYALEQARRAAAGWGALAGNHVLIASGGVVIALCHLRWRSLRVRVGDRVLAGTPVAECGNSGNSTEPHLHLQVIDSADIAEARPVPMTFPGGLPRTGQLVDALGPVP